jgi:hypothetical protein
MRSKQNHQCYSSLAACPMKSEFVHLATAATKTWMKTPYLCDFKQRLQHNNADDENQINILIMGGSVTKGTGTEGCVCDSNICADSIDLHHCIKHHDESRCCSWTRQLMRWIKHKTNATVNFIDYGNGGTSSITALQLYVDTIPIDSLKRLDLVLLDYSLNDAISIGKENDPVKYHALEYSVEWLIRRLLTRFSGLQPVIVLLAGQPSWNQCFSVYEKMARYYSIPFWSYDSVIKSPALMDKSYAKLLSWQDNSKELAGNHPPWPVHLFTADLYAAIMEEEFSRCTTYYEMKQETPLLLALPAPITNPDGIHLCDYTATAFLQISAEEVHFHRSSIGYYSGGWQVVEDRKNKWGWIDEFAHDSSISRHHRSLVFTLDNNYSHSSNTGRDVLIRVAFLKTYNNTGQFDVYLCGKFLQSIDTCWGDPRIKVSTTEISFIRLAYGVFPSECKHDQQPKTLEFRHVWMDHIHDATSNSTTRAIVGCDRQHQKVKLIDVTVCTAA